MNNGAPDDWAVDDGGGDQDTVEEETTAPKGWGSAMLTAIGAAMGTVSVALIVIAVAVLAIVTVLWIALMVFLKTFTTVGS